jgi:hypothetical protein
MEVKDVENVREMARKWARETPINSFPPEARYITGRKADDAMLHYFSLESGLDPIFSPGLKHIIGYDIIDEKQFAWFTLRWS